MEERLKECPFCGGRAELTKAICDAMIHCTVCMNSIIQRRSDGINKFNAEKIIIKKWNTRHEPKENL